MKPSKSAKLFGVVLAAGLVGGLIGVGQEGWNIGDTVGLTVWSVLLICWIIWVKKENPA
jgi:hypothetical protein